MLAGCPEDVACPEGTFRCVDACLAFGSVCGDAGMGDGAVSDGGAPLDSSTDTPPVDPCVAPDGLVVARYCRTDVVVHDCRSDTEMVCRGDQHCEEYPLGDQHQAGCYFDGSAPCDLAVDPPATCDGAVITLCQDGGGPVPTTFDVDCRALLGWEDATCVAAGEGFRCAAPRSTPCDPETDPPRCDGSQRVSCRTGLSFADGSVWVREACPAGDACFESRVDGRGLCLGSDATPTTPITSGTRVERCTDETSAQVTTDGYTYSTHCPLATQFTPDGEITEQSVCRIDGLGGGECISPRAAESCAAGAPPVCAAPGSEPDPASRVCVDQGDGRRLRVSRPCVIPVGTTSSTRSTCEGGVCDHVGPCAVTDPPACVSVFRVSCDPGTLIWTAEICPGSTCSGGACL